MQKIPFQVVYTILYLTNKNLGSYLIGLMRDGRVNIEDHLVDSNNRPIAATVNFEVRYSSPENMEGNFDSPTVSKYVQQQSLDDDQQMLLDIEQNIANLEKSLNQGIWIQSLLNFSKEIFELIKVFLAKLSKKI